MNITGKIVIVVVLIAAVVIVIAVKQNQTGRDTTTTLSEFAGQPVPAEYKPEHLTGKGLPALIDLGAGTCIPCKLMAPILEELKKELAGKLEVQILDVRENPELVEEYRISVIPVQIFYDASGKELFRHEGFYSKEDILDKWKDLGIDL